MNQKDVGDYVLGKALGSGTTGKVKLAVHRTTGKQVAIKIIKKSMFDVKPDLQRKIRREIALMRLLDHPHLLKLIEVCESNRHLYIILEYASHGELFDYLVARRRLEIPVALHFFREIIYGLDYLHAHAICHRDLKPENILLDEFDHIKVADFGFARWMKSNIADTSCGSPHYAAPEVIRGERYDGRHADIWSCGVILYALLAGRLPFDDPSFRTLLAKVKAGRFVMPDFPEPIQDLISRMLTVKIESRITIEEIKCHPAFRLYLPDSYTIPAPLPIPLMNEPIDPNTVDPLIMGILKCIGYSSDAEINEEFLAPVHTNAKVFYQMFIGRVSFDQLPWPGQLMYDPLSSSPQSAQLTNVYNLPDEAFLMSPRLIPNAAMQTTNDPFHRRVQAPDVSSPDIRSLAQKPDWYADQIPGDGMQGGEQEEGNLEQLFIEIPVPVEILMTKLQIFLSQSDIKWFHQSDMELVTKRLETGMVITFKASFESIESLELSAVLKHGNKDEFDHLVNELSAEIMNLVHNDNGQF